MTFQCLFDQYIPLNPPDPIALPPQLLVHLPLPMSDFQQNPQVLPPCHQIRDRFPFPAFAHGDCLKRVPPVEIPDALLPRGLGLDALLGEDEGREGGQVARMGS